MSECRHESINLDGHCLTCTKSGVPLILAIRDQLAAAVRERDGWLERAATERNTMQERSLLAEDRLRTAVEALEETDDELAGLLNDLANNPDRKLPQGRDGWHRAIEDIRIIPRKALAAIRGREGKT